MLDATATYEPAISTGLYSYATHGAVVAVDPEAAFVEVTRLRGRRGLRYDGQPDARRRPDPRRRRAGHRHRSVRKIPYDETGQPLAGTLADYLLPGAAEMPAIKIGHLHTPTPHTEYGMKGMGEGGAVAPPAAIANALRDALSGIGAEVNETPITPRRVLAAIRRARTAASKT